MSSTDSLRDEIVARSDRAFADLDVDSLVQGAARRGRRRRRARVGATALTLAAAAAVTLQVVPGMLPGNDVSTVRTPPADRLGFPGALGGGLLLDASAGQGTASVTVAAGRSGLSWSTACQPDDGTGMDIMVEITAPGANGPALPTFGERCRPGEELSAGSFGAYDLVAPWREAGIEPGDRVTFTVRDVDPRTTGQVSIAAFELVPLEQYPVAPAPEPIPPLIDRAAFSKDGVAVAPVLDERFTWQGRTTRTFALDLPAGAGNGVTTWVSSRTPADVRVLVDGQSAGRAVFYDFGAGPTTLYTSPALDAGAASTVEIEVRGHTPDAAGEIAIAIVTSPVDSVVWPPSS